MQRLNRAKNNTADATANRLFSLFAQNRRQYTAGNNEALHIDWNVFCKDLVHESPEHLSSWQRLSEQILKLHRSMIVPTVLPIMPLFDGKIDRSFNVAMFFTLKALTIKGVSPATIARTQSALNKKHSQQSKHAMPAAKSRWIMPSFSEHPHIDSVAPAFLVPITRSASLPAGRRSRKSQQAEVNLLLTPPLGKSISMPSTKTESPSRDTIVHIRTNRLLTIA